jgi:hypothetical protein
MYIYVLHLISMYNCLYIYIPYTHLDLYVNLYIYIYKLRNIHIQIDI